MAKRKDGKETKQKLLDVACHVFAEKGFREAKITEICRRAGANVAAVNYYFGDKESLYVAAWRQAIEQFITSDTIPPEHLPPTERLRLAIHRIIQKTLIADEEGGYFRRIELMELANPTGLIDETWNELIAPRKQEMQRIVRDVAGPAVSEDAVKLCTMTISNQCRGFILMQKSRLETFDDEAFTPERVKQIAEHIANFSIAGIAAIRNQAVSSMETP
jgi:TetR/AcrR family transcriptional regulator, regulator of cefoperazone and chloramphenicol sensitivity